MGGGGEGGFEHSVFKVGSQEPLILYYFLQSDVVLKVGSKNPILETIKALLDRAAPLLVDEQCIKELFKLAKDAVEGLSDDEEDEYEWHESSGTSPVGKKSLALLLVSQISVYTMGGFKRGGGRARCPLPSFLIGIFLPTWHCYW